MVSATKKPRQWNPRYLQYCRAIGYEGKPDTVIALDRERWPGGHMCGFILWMSARWCEFAALRGYRRTASGHNDTPMGPAEHADFDRWLAARVSPPDDDPHYWPTAV